jgi:hypothetical protein
MTVQKGISAFSFIGICGAILFATLPLWFALWPETLGVTAVDLTAHILILMGMIGIYFNYADKLGKFGFIAVVGVIIGFVFQIFMKAASGFIKPVLLEYVPQTLENQIAPSPLGEVIMASFIIFPFSIVLFGLAIGLSTIPQRKLGFLLMVSPFGFVIPFGVFISPIIFAFIFISIAYPIVKGRKEQQTAHQLMNES